MRWYDYITCVILADFITAAIFSVNLPLLLISVALYVVYEKVVAA